jgi:hypothetical protein
MEKVMLPNNRIHDCVTDDDLRLYNNIVDVVQRLVSQANGSLDSKGCRLPYNCHSMCRAFARVYPKLACVDGYHFTVKILTEGGFRPEIAATTQHSWLRTPSDAIIDPTPVSLLSLNPIMFPAKDPIGETYAGTYLEFPDVMKKVDIGKVISNAREWELLIRKINDTPF